MIMSGSNQVVRNPRKRSRTMRLSDGEDLISNLPDCLISRILSCLPTKDAVRTCVLSKHWEYKWASIYNIDVINYDWTPSKTFADFVKRVPLHLQAIRSFRFISYSRCDPTRLASWISAALRCKIQILELIYTHDTVILPRSLIDNSSLRKLKISVRCFEVPTSVCFRNLTTLHFHHISILNESSDTNYLIFSFPVLKTLELVVCKWLNVKIVEILAPKLTTLKSDDCTTEVDDCSINVIGDELKEFESLGCVPDAICVTGTQVVNAAFKYNGDAAGSDQLYAKKGRHVRVNLNRFSSLVKFELDLTSPIVEAIRKWRAQLPLPRFGKLTQLALRAPFDSEELLELLNAAPYLKFLSIDPRKEVLWDHYDKVKSVPLCVVSHLEEVVFNYYGRRGLKFNLAKFLLKNGIKLKKFHIFHSHEDMRSRIMKRLSAFPKVSTSLKISTPSWEEKIEIFQKRGYPYCY